jgi:hypothetical protein
MDPEIHLFVSAALASVVYLFTGSIPAAVAFFVGGFLIDVDHVLEYWMYRRKINLSGEFFTEYAKKSGRLYIFLHSYELLAGVLVLAMLTKSAIVWGLWFGMGQHMILDMIGNNLTLKTFSLSYRIANNFRSDIFFKKGK